MRYFAIIEGEQRGPYTLEELEEAGVGPDTYVWCKSMTDWQQAGEVADICRYFRRTLADRMHPSSPSDIQSSSPADAEDEYADVPLRWRGIIRRHGVPASMNPEPEPDTSTPPRTWTVEAVLALILCCPLTGAVALYFALHCRRLWNAGKKEEAHKASDMARLWVLITIVAGCFLSALMIKFVGKV